MLDVVSVEAALLEAIRFVPYEDTAAALEGLRALGLRVVVVSNWDVSLHEVLGRLGLDLLVDGAISSAEAGAAKPDPAIFRAALALAGDVDPAAAVHAGDSVAADVAGARAAGIAAVLVDRGAGGGMRSAGAGAAVPPGVPVVGDLRALVAHLS